MKNKYFDVFEDLEEQQILAEKLESVMRAVRDSIQYSPNSAEDYIGAISLVDDLLYSHQKKLEDLVNRGWNVMESESIEEAGGVDE